MPNLVLSTCTRTSCKCVLYDKPIWVEFHLPNDNLFMFRRLVGCFELLGFKNEHSILRVRIYGSRNSTPITLCSVYKFFMFVSVSQPCLTIGSRFYSHTFLLRDKFKRVMSHASTGIEGSLQILREGSRAKHPLWIIAFAYVGTSIYSSMEIGAGCFASCYALCCRSTHKSRQGSSESWSCWD